MPNFPYIPLGGNRIKGFDLMAAYLDDSKEGDPSPKPADLEDK